jgi:acyl-CoA synthetase (AMP-forming)/AMP-acid ligase II
MRAHGRCAAHATGGTPSEGFKTIACSGAGVIIGGDSNFRPLEVEAALRCHPGVREASVVGAADAEWGEVVVAFIAGTGPRARVPDGLEHMARLQRPRRDPFVGSLPKNHCGGPSRIVLRNQPNQGD